MRIGSLCTGVGGLDMAVQEAFGGDLVFVADKDPQASELLSRRFPDVPNLGDLMSIEWDQAPRVDLISAGFPCQPFSLAGRQKGEGDDRNAWPGVRAAIRSLAPRFVVLENVPGIRTKGGLGTVLGDLASLGYDAQWTSVRASDADAPHRRERVFLLAYPNGEPRIEWGAAGSGDQEGGGPLDHAGRSDVGALLPTPTTHDIKAGLKTYKGGGESLPSALLRTPTAALSMSGSTKPPAERRAKGQTTTLDDQIIGSLLPTAKATDGTKGWAGQRGSKGDYTLPSATQRGAGWAEYRGAIERWETIMGPAPEPTEPSTRSATGKRLSARFVEWMIGLPAGWVTDLGFTQSAMFRLLGNTVVPQQGALALRELLARLEEPSVSCRECRIKGDHKMDCSMRAEHLGKNQVHKEAA